MQLQASSRTLPRPAGNVATAGQPKRTRQGGPRAPSVRPPPPPNSFSSVVSSARSGNGVAGPPSTAGVVQATPAVLFTNQQQQLRLMNQLEGDAPETEQRSVSLAETRRVSEYENKPCFGCIVGLKPPKDPEDYESAVLWSVFKDNIHRLHPSALYKLISDTQKKLYVDPFESQADRPYPLWTPGQVEEHLNNHIVYYDFEVTKDIRRLETLVEFLEDNVGLEAVDDGGASKPQPNEKIVDLLLKAIDKREAILCRYEKEKGQQQHQ